MKKTLLTFVAFFAMVAMSFAQTTPTVYKTIAELKTNATSKDASISYEFQDLLVTRVAGSNIYATDGTEGIFFYRSSKAACKAGDKITGAVSAKLQSYKGLVEVKFADFTNVKVTSSGNAVTPKVVTIAEFKALDFAKYQSMFVKLEKVKFQAEAWDNYRCANVTDGTNTVAVRDENSSLKTEVLSLTDPYNIYGFVNSFNNENRLAIAVAEDLQIISTLLDAESAWAAPEVVLLPGAEWNVENTFATKSDAQVVYSSSDENVAVVDVAGKVSVKSFGHATITAETAKTKKYQASKVAFELYVIEGAGTLENAYTPGDVQYYSEKATGEFWVSGEVVGVYDNNKVVETMPTTVASNIALRLNGVTVPVQLKSGSEPRAKLNLVDNPALKGTKVWVKGQLQKYFGVPGVKSVVEFSLDATTGIESVESENGAQVIYDLSGRRVEKAVKGLYIVNGKKVYVK